MGGAFVGVRLSVAAADRIPQPDASVAGVGARPSLDGVVVAGPGFQSTEPSHPAGVGAGHVLALVGRRPGPRTSPGAGDFVARALAKNAGARHVSEALVVVGRSFRRRLGRAAADRGVLFGAKFGNRGAGPLPDAGPVARPGPEVAKLPGPAGPGGIGAGPDPAARLRDDGADGRAGGVVVGGPPRRGAVRPVRGVAAPVVLDLRGAGRSRTLAGPGGGGEPARGRAGPAARREHAGVHLAAHVVREAAVLLEHALALERGVGLAAAGLLPPLAGGSRRLAGQARVARLLRLDGRVDRRSGPGDEVYDGGGVDALVVAPAAVILHAAVLAARGLAGGHEALRHGGAPSLLIGALPRRAPVDAGSDFLGRPGGDGPVAVDAAPAVDPGPDGRVEARLQKWHGIRLLFGHVHGDADAVGRIDLDGGDELRLGGVAVAGHQYLGHVFGH